VAKVAKGIGIGLAAVGSAAIVAGKMVFDLVKEVSTAGDEIAKTARAIGMSTDALQEFRYIGERSGVSVDEMTVALKKLSINLGDATTETKKSLGRLGLSVEQLKKAGPDKSLLLVADAMAKISDPTERAAIAVDLFGKGGVKMSNVLAEGSAGMAKLSAEAHRLGYVLGEEALNNSEALNDSILNMKTSFGAISKIMGAEFMPVVNKAVQRITEVFVSAGPSIKAFSKRISGLVDRLFTTAADILPSIMDMIGGVFDALLPIADTLVPVLVDLMKTVLPIFVTIVKSLGPGLKAVGNIISVVASGLLRILEPALKALAPIFEALGPLIEEVAIFIGDMLFEAFNVLGPIIEDLTPIIQLLSDAFRGLVEAVKFLFGEVKTFLDPNRIENRFIEEAQKEIKKSTDPKRIADLTKMIEASGGVVAPKVSTYTGAGREPSFTTEASTPTTATPLSSNSVTTVNRNSSATLDVNFRNTPEGTTMKQMGKAPGVTLNTGFAGGAR
jgi:hypothetical protein